MIHDVACLDEIDNRGRMRYCFFDHSHSAMAFMDQYPGRTLLSYREWHPDILANSWVDDYR